MKAQACDCLCVGVCELGGRNFRLHVMGFFGLGLKKKKSSSYHLGGTHSLCARHYAGPFTRSYFYVKKKNSLLVCFYAGPLRGIEYSFHLC